MRCALRPQRRAQVAIAIYIYMHNAHTEMPCTESLLLRCCRIYARRRVFRLQRSAQQQRSKHTKRGGRRHGTHTQHSTRKKRVENEKLKMCIGALECACVCVLRPSSSLSASRRRTVPHDIFGHSRGGRYTMGASSHRACSHFTLHYTHTTRTCKHNTRRDAAAVA